MAQYAGRASVNLHTHVSFITLNLRSGLWDHDTTVGCRQSYQRMLMLGSKSWRTVLLAIGLGRDQGCKEAHFSFLKARGNRNSLPLEKLCCKHFPLFFQLFFRNRVQDEQGYILYVRKNALQILIPKYGLEGTLYLSPAKGQVAKVNFTYSEEVGVCSFRFENYCLDGLFCWPTVLMCALFFNRSKVRVMAPSNSVSLTPLLFN